MNEDRIFATASTDDLMLCLEYALRLHMMSFKSNKQTEELVSSILKLDDNEKVSEVRDLSSN
jgi:hypothetical protein